MQKIFSFLFALLLGTGTLMATEGAVFLPASGYRYRNTVTNHVLYEQTNTIEDQGYYWSTSFVDDWQASCVFFNGTEVRLEAIERNSGRAVRLVQPASKSAQGSSLSSSKSKSVKPRR